MKHLKNNIKQRILNIIVCIQGYREDRLRYLRTLVAFNELLYVKVKISHKIYKGIRLKLGKLNKN